MLPPTNQSCSRCGRDLRDAETRYLVTVSLTADFDGRLPLEADPSESASRTARMWREIEQKSEEELEAEVAQKLSFVLCKPCRDEWVRHPFGSSPSNDAPAFNPLH